MAGLGGVFGLLTRVAESLVGLVSGRATAPSQARSLPSLEIRSKVTPPYSAWHGGDLSSKLEQRAKALSAGPSCSPARIAEARIRV